MVGSKRLSLDYQAEADLLDDFGRRHAPMVSATKVGSVATLVATSTPSDPSSASRKPRRLHKSDAAKPTYNGRIRLRALWEKTPVEVRGLSGALPGLALMFRIRT